MVVFDNLARILQDILQLSSVSRVSDLQSYILEQWKLLGQEPKGRLIVGWVEKIQNDPEPNTCIGIYQPMTNKLQVLFRINDTPNIIQASVNSHGNLVSFVVKESNEKSDIYYHYVEIVKPLKGFQVSRKKNKPSALTGVRKVRQQIMSTFLDGASSDISKLLVLIHLESVTMYKLKAEDDEKLLVIKMDAIMRDFMWAQWDCDIQALYFIHFRKTSVPIEEDENIRIEESPTLSCFQFHRDLPHETVLNVPLNLPSIAKSVDLSCQMYEDDPIPLRIHDCSLDLIVVSDGKGTICICHHYLYEPVKHLSAEVNSNSAKVHFAYSVTLLHHGSVIHAAVPGIPWQSAKTMRPVFALLGGQYLVVYASQIFTHLLDIGLSHEPNCHILMDGTLSAIPANASRLVSLKAEFIESSGYDYKGTELQPVVMIDVNTMDLIEFEIEITDLMKSLADDDCTTNRLSILHYLLVHADDFENVEEALSILCKNPTDINLTKFFKEVLIGGAYGLSKHNNSTETIAFETLLPLTFQESLKSNNRTVNHVPCLIRQEILWNTAVMLLSPQQRLKPFISDIWRTLWERLIKPIKNLRFKPSQVVEKVFISWGCFKPETLSCCGTPLSPALRQEISQVDVSYLSDEMGQKSFCFDLPFIEVDRCQCNSQEHVVSINLRELNLHLLKNCLEERPIHVHSFASRYVFAQLEISKFLCHVLVKLAGVDTAKAEKGFPLIMALNSRQRCLLFMFYQRYFSALTSLAYPLPRGFTSFFCYLGYTSLPFQYFMMYLHNNVFELQVDVMKEIMRDIEDTKEGVTKKLSLLLLLPRPQAKQLLNSWPHGVSLMIRAREHALNLLSGVQSSHCQGLTQLKRPLPNTRGLAAFPSANGLSPLDTFLDLLTAKASLADLDFNLLIDATISSTQNSF